MQSSSSPVSPIRQQQHYHHPSTMMKVETTTITTTITTTSPQSVYSPFKNNPNTTRTMIEKENNFTTSCSSTVENVSFRSAARRFSALPTVVKPAANHHSAQLPPLPRTPKATTTATTSYSAPSKTKVFELHKTPIRQSESTATTSSLTIPKIPELECLDNGVVVETDRSKTEQAKGTTKEFKVVKRDVSFRTLAHRFAAKKGTVVPNPLMSTSIHSTTPTKTNSFPNVPTTPSSTQDRKMNFQQRRGSAGDFDPRVSPFYTPKVVVRTTDSIKSNKEYPVIPLSPITPLSKYEVRSSLTTPPTTVTHSLTDDQYSATSTPVATTKVYVSSNNATPASISKAYEEYFNNKVFQKRYNAAATNIQRLYRGYKQRYHVARIVSAMKIQKIVRQNRECRINERNAAGTTIQKLVRGWSTRLRLQIFQLEYQLRQIDQRHARELYDIEQWKEKEYKLINDSIGIKNVKYMEQSKRNEQMIEKANKVIRCIRKENKKLRDKNETLQAAINQLIEENDMLDRQAREYRTFMSTVDRMTSLNNENESLTALVEQFEQRKEQFEEAIERRNERIMYENKVGRLYLHRIQQMVQLIDETCKDINLILHVEELCTHCNTPGTGLDSADDTNSMDISERNF